MQYKDSRIDTKELVMCNLYPHSHSFQLTDTLVSVCDICGYPTTPFSTNAECTKCHMVIHSDCSESCYLPCVSLEEATTLKTEKAHEDHLSPENDALLKRSLSERGILNGHHVIESCSSLVQNATCVVCRSIIVSLSCLHCRICGVYLHSECKDALQNTCRPISLPSERDYHWFVNGNCLLNANTNSNNTCIVCKQSVGSRIALTDFRCCMCGMVVHGSCIHSAPPICYHGVLGKYVISPSLTQMDEYGDYKAVYRRDKTPMIFFVNPKSGNLLGEFLQNKTQELFSLPQVCNVLQGFDKIVKYIEEYGNKFIAVICGGDGTVGWVMNEMKKANKKPQYFIIPLGTGNDLSICTGWGGGYDGGDLITLLRQVQYALVQPLDRWRVSIHHKDAKEDRTIVLNNYFSVGIDAGIALDFHQRRQANPKMFGSRIGNKVQYMFSSPVALTGDVGDINKVIQLRVDGVNIELPPLEGIAFLNVSTYGGGNKFFDVVTDEECMLGMKDSNFGDGLIEVIAFSSFVEMPFLMTGMQQPVKIAQGTVIEITVLEKKPAQTDGEPFMLEPCNVIISLFDKVDILVKNPFY
ncbi:diacylglycerol kinase, theta, putative [Entamoeba invadens IP1]|uniref:diacylglycerol kinase, theta, putative n=1 Tax=Entamoeba invadens IP1 TaxID=370355 RepID=UPI0002C3DAE8|nr:diacylglycerol kinase, theta, putative [Entamoeba invadens IP1]ELP94040.1 diacylglycerol kinase, theta, putative [Entamoeba invadens IP1]|eukprot:XP_004260811.1 diacylglycerol kinase, theta, putative [Entamoeba invadens IP1]